MQNSSRRKTLPTSQACKTLPTTVTINASAINICEGTPVTIKDNTAYAYNSQMVPVQWTYTYTPLAGSCTFPKDSVFLYASTDGTKPYGWTPPTSHATGTGSTIIRTLPVGTWKVKMTARIYLNTSEDALNSTCPNCKTSIPLSDSVTVTVKPKPTLTLAQDASCPPVLSSTAANTTVCGVAGSVAFPTYAWTGVASSASTASTTSTAGGTYSLQVTDGNACTATASITVAVCAPLGIRLLSFVGKNNGSSNELTWATSEELNNDHFDLERASDGKNFTKIAEQKSKGQGTQRLDYVYNDEQPNKGINYYRLRQVDADGKAEYSPTVVLQSKVTMTTIDRIFPNPSKEQITLVVSSSANSEALIEIYDMSGKKMEALAAVLTEGITNLSINTNDLPVGDYLLKLLCCDKETAVSRFSKR